MAVGERPSEQVVCRDHVDCKVALFCQTCEQLICTKCISQGPNSSARHREHVYLDILEAYDMHMEEFEKVIAKLKDDLESKKMKRIHSQNEVQNLKFAALRKKTQVEKCTRSLKDKVVRKEKQYLDEIDNILRPAIERADQVFKEAEYDVVSQEGLIGGAESLGRLPKHKCVTFLQGIGELKKQLAGKNTNDAISTKLQVDEKDLEEEPCDKHTLCIRRGSENDEKVGEGHKKELGELQKLYLDLHQEKRMLEHAFDVPSEVPSKVKILPAWCTADCNGASLVWKFLKSENIDNFNVYYKLYRNRSDDIGPVLSKFSKVKIHKFTNGRVSCVLRDVRPNKCYIVRIAAVNSKGESSHQVCYITTPKFQPDRCISMKPPRYFKQCCSCMNRIMFALFAVAAFFLYSLIFVAAIAYVVQPPKLCEMSQIYLGETNASAHVCNFAGTLSNVVEIVINGDAVNRANDHCDRELPEIASNPIVENIIDSKSDIENGGWIDWLSEAILN